jgi:putative membrane protein
MIKKIDALNFLTEAELLQVKDCIRDAESLTSGEIKVVIASASSIIPRQRKSDQERAVIWKAKSLFRKLGINKTRDSTGILILISLEEHMVRVHPDAAIDRILSESTWQPLVNCIIDGIKGGLPAKGICMSISQIGTLLAKHFPIKHDDKDELPNEVVVIGRW